MNRIKFALLIAAALASMPALATPWVEKPTHTPCQAENAPILMVGETYLVVTDWNNPANRIHYTPKKSATAFAAGGEEIFAAGQTVSYAGHQDPRGDCHAETMLVTTAP